MAQVLPSATTGVVLTSWGDVVAVAAAVAADPGEMAVASGKEKAVGKASFPRGSSLLTNQVGKHKKRIQTPKHYSYSKPCREQVRSNSSKRKLEP